MNSVTKNRGPDFSGVFIDGVSFGHNRLSIIDLDRRANQPFRSPDGRYTLIYNGELYNFKDLKKSISYDFKTTSDTEVVLAAFLRWGKDCVKYFNGMYAFAIWDAKEKRLVLARDPRGIKPLYYSVLGNTLIFSSEIRGILSHEVPRTLDQEALGYFFSLLYVPEPHTLFSSIKKVPHGNVATWKSGKITFETFEPNQFAPVPEKSYTKRKEQVRDIVGKTVQRQMVADVSVGVFLSGGVDSTAILDSAVSAGFKPETFSTSFDLAGVNSDTKFNIDAELAEKTASHYGVKHTTFSLSIKDIFEALIPSMEALEEPNANPTFIPAYLLSEKVRSEVSVVLSGTGGDEFFGGYDRYKLSRRVSLAQSIFPPLRLLAPQGVERYAKFMVQKKSDLHGVPHADASSFLKNKFFPIPSGRSMEEHLMRVDQETWLVDDALLQADKMSMAYGLEMRVPFLDEVLVQYAHNLPLSDKVSISNTKILLKEAFADNFPAHVLGQPKRGWFTPSAKWLREEAFTVFAKEVLSPSYYPETNKLFDWDIIQEALESHISKQGYHRTLLWSVISFQIWARANRVTI